MTEIELRNVSRWYGNVVAINDITMTIGPGVTGLLGPNGAGKTTLLHLISGFLEPSRGEVTIGGAASWRNPGIYRTLGLVPEHPSVYAFLTGGEFVRATARLHKLRYPDPAADRAIGIVEMAEAQHRKRSTYSRGCGSGSRRPACWCTIPGCSCWTSRSTGWTRGQRAAHDRPARGARPTIFWPTRANQAGLGQYTEIIQKDVPHPFRVSLLEQMISCLLTVRWLRLTSPTAPGR